MGFFKPAWMTKSLDKQVKAKKSFENETDIIKLLEIVNTAPLPIIRVVAAQKINDQATLLEIIKNKTGGAQVVSSVMSKITDSKCIDDIAKNINSDPFFRDGAIIEAVINNPHISKETLGYIAKNDKSSYLCILANEVFFKRFHVCAAHDFEYGHPYHPYNTGATFRDAKCRVCGKTEMQSYGWDDNW